MARPKSRAQARTFHVPMNAQATPESGFLYRCTCGFQWWASDQSWVGCRKCHEFGNAEVSVMAYADAAGLYRVTTGGLGMAVVDGNTWACSLREYA